MEYGYSKIGDSKKKGPTPRVQVSDDLPEFANHLRFLDPDGDYGEADMDTDDASDEYSDNSDEDMDDDGGEYLPGDDDAIDYDELPLITQQLQSVALDRHVLEDDRPDDPPLFEDQDEDQDSLNFFLQYAHGEKTAVQKIHIRKMGAGYHNGS
ncbi:Telomerase protein component 1 [Hypoxylon texense]